MSLPKKIAYNTIIQIISKIIATILGLFALALMTRYLGQSGFGEYTTIITFLSFFAVIGDLGLTLVTVQMISGAKEDENKILNNLFSLRLISVLIFLGLAPVVTLFLPYDQSIKIGIMIGAISFIFPALNQILVGLFQKNLKMEAVSLAEVFSRLLLVGGIYLSIQGKFGLYGILWATVASTLSSFLIHYFYSRRLTKLRFRIDFSLWRQIVTKTWPLAVTIAFNLIYLKADTLILSLLKNPAAVGLYGAAYKIIDVLTAVPFIFAGIILPILTADWLNKKTEHFEKVLQRSFDIMAFCAIPLVVGAQFFAKPLMLLVAGRDFVAAGPILQILIVAIAAIFLGCIFAHAIIALDKQRKMIGIYAFTGFSSLAAYLIFIPRYSYFGAAGVTIYSEVLIALASIYYVWRYSGFLPKLNTFLKSLLAASLMGVFLFFCPIIWLTTVGGLIAVLISAFLIYLIFILLFGGFSKEDLSLIFRRSPRQHLTPYN